MKKNFILLSALLPFVASADTIFHFEEPTVEGDNITVKVSLDAAYATKNVRSLEADVSVSSGDFSFGFLLDSKNFDSTYSSDVTITYMGETKSDIFPVEEPLFTITYSKGATLTLSSMFLGDNEDEEVEIPYKEVEINNLTLGMNGYSTYGSNVYAVEFVGAEAYSVVVDGSKAVSTAIGNNVVAQGTGALLKGAKGDLVLCVQSYETSAAASNELKVADGSSLLSDVYVFATKSQGSAFYKYSGTVPAGKAYLEATAGARLDLDLEDETGIDSIELEQSDAIFNLQGNKLEKAEKGISIVNGKKVMF